MKIRFVFLALGFFISISCSHEFCPENQDNPILSKHEISSSAYQKELSRLIQKQPELVLYYFQERFSKNTQSFMVLEAIGPDFCGQIHVLIEDEDEQTRKLQNDSGRNGVSLRGLKLAFRNPNAPIYQSMSGMID